MTPQEANAKYLQVGVLCAPVRDGNDPSLDAIERDDETRALVENKACTLGGNMLVPIGFCSTGAGRGTVPGIELGVYAIPAPATSTAR
jgi:hypothetical protein